MSETKKRSAGNGRREFLGASIAGLAAVVAGCGPNKDGERVMAAAQNTFPVRLTIEGGLLRLNKSAGNIVELAYPRNMKDDKTCDFPQHSMYLEVERGDFTVKGELPADWPWDLTGYTVTVAVPGSTRKPDPSQWRAVPPKPAPAAGSAKELAWLDWIPTIEGKPKDWDARAATKLVFPSGDWSALTTADPEIKGESFSLKDPDGTEVRPQYVTDRARWEDAGTGPIVLTFEQKGKSVGTITFTEESGRPGVELALTTPPMGGLVQPGKPVEHYCMYYSFLTDVAHKFVPFRSGTKAFIVPTQRKDGVPGRFCPGGKIIA